MDDRRVYGDAMSVYIDRVVSEAALDAFENTPGYREAMRAAIRAADVARGLKEEREDTYTYGTGEYTGRVRLVSDWRPRGKPG